MKRMIWKENGMVIIEATIVFPVMFFVILFLLYMGNMFYVRSAIDSLTYEAAIRGAALCADPLLEDIKKDDGSVSVPKKIDDIKPYHHLFAKGDIEKEIKEELSASIAKAGPGFYAGMGAAAVTTEAKFRNHILYLSFTVKASYNLKFPLRFLGSDEPVILRMESKAVAPVTDTGEFIYLVDMAVDYGQRMKFKEKVSQAMKKVEEFIK